jgi:hypothetical protein
MGRNDRQVDLEQLTPNAIPATDYHRATDLPRFQAAQDRWVDYEELERIKSSIEEVEQATERAEIEGEATGSGAQKSVTQYLERRASKRYTEFYRVAWREMIPNNTERSLYAALIPPGPAHIHGVRSMALANDLSTVAVAGFWTSLPIDYMLRVTGRGHLDMADAHSLPVPDLAHPLVGALVLRTLRLNCLTTAYARLWHGLYREEWAAERWAVEWPTLPALGSVASYWTASIPLRTELARRAAMVELDAAVAVMLGIEEKDLIQIYKARFPQIATYEEAMWFDANGRRISANFNAYGHRQQKGDYEDLRSYLKDPEHACPPGDYQPPFYRANRVQEYQEAYSMFVNRAARGIDRRI